MAQDAVGLRTEASKPSFLWTKLFTAFRIALDPKKLLLAAAGLLVMSFGWWLLSVVFFTPRSQPPRWPSENYSEDDKGWESFKAERRAWNLLYEMAGPVPASRKEAQAYDIADLANDRQEFDKLDKIYKKMKEQTDLRQASIEVVGAKEKGEKSVLKISGAPDLHFDLPAGGSLEDLQKALKDVRTAELVGATYQPARKELTLKGQVLAGVEPQEWSQLLQKLAESKSLDDLDREIRQGRWEEPVLAQRVLDLLRKEGQQFKPAGALRSWPWAEPRGPNPLLFVIGADQESLSLGASAGRRWLGWLVDDALPVLLEPLLKLLRPIYYFFQPGMGFWNRLYLASILFWTFLTWAVFGGAITRIAVVQAARPNESVRLKEALNFARERFLSYLGAPLLPLAGLIALMVLLILFGLMENILLLGELASVVIIPLALLLGVIATVILIGLLGLPLMYATLSAEGSDSFDAISRSYSYLYQAPWRYLGYAAVALGYGIVTVFFIGLASSLAIYLARWGLNLLPVTSQRELSFLFAWAPTSFGWRDLLLSGSPHAHLVEVIQPSGLPALQLGLLETPEYEFTLINKIGTLITSFWLYLFFLVVVGFGYSFFWTSSTIIYLLLRRQIDETDLDEVYLEEAPEEGMGPVVSVTPEPAESKPGTTSLTLVEPPPAPPPAAGTAGSSASSAPERVAPASAPSTESAPPQTAASQADSASASPATSPAEPPAPSEHPGKSFSSEG
jgi:hypothetical protein